MDSFYVFDRAVYLLFLFDAWQQSVEPNFGIDGDWG